MPTRHAIEFGAIEEKPQNETNKTDTHTLWQATVGPVARSCRDTGMKIEPIGNAGALEMCSAWSTIAPATLM